LLPYGYRLSVIGYWLMGGDVCINPVRQFKSPEGKRDGNLAASLRFDQPALGVK